MIFSSCASNSISHQRSTSYEENLEGILESIKILSEDYSGDEWTATVLSELVELSQDPKVQFIIEDSDEQFIDSLVIFNAPAESSEQIQIIISQSLLEVYPAEAAKAMTLIIRELSLVREYFLDPDYYAYYGYGTFPQLFYQLDALYLQALFIRDYLVPAALPLSEYESYILESLNTDNLSTASFILLRTNASLAQLLYNYGLEYDADKLNAEEVMTEIIALSEEITGYLYSQDLSEWETYISLINALTLDVYLAEIVNPLLGDSGNGLSDQQIKAYVQALNNLKTEIQKEVLNQQDFLYAILQDYDITFGIPLQETE
jgi:hypothetical protein